MNWSVCVFSSYVSRSEVAGSYVSSSSSLLLASLWGVPAPPAAGSGQGFFQSGPGRLVGFSAEVIFKQTPGVRRSKLVRGVSWQKEQYSQSPGPEKKVLRSSRRSHGV